MNNSSPFFMKISLILFFAFQVCTVNSQLSILDPIVDNWHANATNTNFDAYFDIMTPNFVFLGTAPGERWTKSEFAVFCKPHFDKGSAWSFTASNRNWVFSKDKKTAWFDEDLATWMEGCRGSGIMVKVRGEWKLAYYNLTVLIENEKIQEFIKLRVE